jgi:hypothetical protein
MNPYRESVETATSVDDSPERNDERPLMFVWMCIGCVLIGSDVWQSDEPWGVAFSLGMLVLLMLAHSVWRYAKPCG